MANHAIWGLVGVGSAVLLLAGVAQAQEGGPFDNPEAPTGPCIVLNQYEVSDAPTAEGSRVFNGLATLENICGRAMEVSFCFELAAEEEASSCFAGPVRPWASFFVEATGSASRIVAFDYEWRYLPYPPEAES